MKTFLKNNRLLISILIVATLLRFIGIKPGYNQFHSDEPIIYGVAVDMIRNGNLDPGRLDYPGVSIYVNYWSYRLSFIPFYWLKYYITHVSQILEGTIHLPISPLEARTILQTYIFGHREINVLFWSRYITAIFGVGCVWLIYILAKKLFSLEVGLIAALLLTFNFRHVLNSHIGLPDVYNAFFLLLLLIMIVNLWRKPSIKNYFWTGVVAGLFFSVKYQFIGFIPLLLIHLSSSFEGRAINLKKLFAPAAWICALVVTLTFFLANPYFLINIENAFYWMETISQKYSMGIKLFNFYPYSYLYHIDYGPIEFLFALAGLLVLTLKDFKKSLIFWSVIAPFFFLMTYYSYGGFYVRNFITTTPLFLITVAYLVDLLTKERRWLTAILLMAILFVPAKNSLISVYYYTKPWNYGLTADWMKNNLPTGAVVAAHPFDPPGGPEVTKTEFKLGGAYGLAEHQENGAQYALINMDWASNPFYVWTNYGLKDFDLFWNKPVSVLRNTYYGLAVEEMFRYQVFSATKPWQAPEADLIMTKIPQWPVTDMRMIKSYQFNSDEDNWSMTKNDQGEVNFDFDKSQGFLALGSVHVGPKCSRMGIMHLTSPVIEIKPEYLYRVKVHLKTASIQTPAQRNAFLRVDFFEDGQNFNGLGIASSVSSRVFGTDDWVLKEIIDRAPEKAKFLTVGLQFSESENNEAWLDDVTVKESIAPVLDITKSPPFIKKDIDLNLLYPYSHGNL